MNNFIPLSIPNFEGNERKYVDDAIDQGWVSTGGAYIAKLEQELAKFLNVDKQTRISCEGRNIQQDQTIAGIDQMRCTPQIADIIEIVDNLEGIPIDQIRVLVALFAHEHIAKANRTDHISLLLFFSGELRKYP